MNQKNRAADLNLGAVNHQLHQGDGRSPWDAGSMKQKNRAANINLGAVTHQLHQGDGWSPLKCRLDEAEESSHESKQSYPKKHMNAENIHEWECLRARMENKNFHGRYRSPASQVRVLHCGSGRIRYRSRLYCTDSYLMCASSLPVL